MGYPAKPHLDGRELARAQAIFHSLEETDRVLPDTSSWFHMENLTLSPALCPPPPVGKPPLLGYVYDRAEIFPLDEGKGLSHLCLSGPGFSKWGGLREEGSIGN